ncbi:diacylglycerol kinase family protein [Paenibacillus sp. 1001270B_150601_E10]|uniref:diacylglycerol kinase family protein n=1 Tax=Paenibacillus sp. 1001270B_150601_E10 TaxID=2787079 RepID=UPI0018A0FE1B|nr:diacylglycerol kinase family protein [Paenibacillus sp. 1001270B_150601_E10]
MKRSWRDTFRVAWEGICYAYRTQRNMKVHVMITACVIPLGIGLQLSSYEWLWIIAAIAIVLAMELMNTAVEAVVDLVMPDLHPLAKIAKDTAAGAVLITAVFAVFVGAIIFAPPLWHLLLSLLP